MLILYNFSMLLSNEYPGFRSVLGWILIVLPLLVSFAIMVSRIQSGPDLAVPPEH